MNITPPDILLCIEVGCCKEATTDLGYCDEHYLINMVDPEEEDNEEELFKL